MATKKVNLVISLKDNVSAGLKRIASGVKLVGTAFKTVAKVGAIAFGGLAVAAAAMAKTIQKSFEFETAKIQLKGLLGTTALAEKRFKELRDFAASTPFQLPDLLEASKHLTIFTEGVLGSAKSLKDIGDAAATTGQGIQDVAFWVGRAYSMLKGGKPFGEAAMRLQEMGILTPKVRSEMERLQSSGASFDVIWGEMNRELGRFSGAMNELSQTGLGKWSTLIDNVGIAMATFGDELSDLAKDGIDGVTKAIQRMVNDGTITKWAEQASGALQAIIDTVKILASGGGESRSKVVGALVNVIIAGFTDAANIMVEILRRFAPEFGKLVAEGIKAAALASVQTSGDRAVAEERIGERGDFELALPFTPAARRNEAKIQEEIQKIVAERIAGLDSDLESSLLNMSRKTKPAITAFQKLIGELRPADAAGKGDLASQFKTSGKTQFAGGGIAEEFRKTGKTNFWETAGLGQIATDAVSGNGSLANVQGDISSVGGAGVEVVGSAAISDAMKTNDLLAEIAENTKGGLM